MKNKYTFSLTDEVDDYMRYVWVHQAGCVNACVWCSTREGHFQVACAHCHRLKVAMATNCTHALAVKRAWQAGNIMGLPRWERGPRILRGPSIRARVTDLEKQVAALTLLVKSNL